MLFHLTSFNILLIYLQGACVKLLFGKPKLEEGRATKQIVALLSSPLEKYNDIVTALTLSNYPCVMDCLDDKTNKVMAMVIIQSIMKNNTCISTADKVKYSYLFKSHSLFFENMVTFALFSF